MRDDKCDVIDPTGDNTIFQVEYRLSGQPDVLLWQIDKDGHMEEAGLEALHQEGTQLVRNWEDMMRQMATQEMVRATIEYNKALAVYRARRAIRAWAMGDVRGEN